jgi:lysophospholipid acyltransferase (LPLAT)-like uncharacterized protein
MTNFEDISAANGPVGEFCRGESAAGKPARKPFSLTRARRFGGGLTKADARRAAVFSTIAYATFWVLEQTVRLRVVGEAAVAPHRRLGPGPLLFAIWHRDYFPIFWYARGSGACVIVSRSADGEILARMLARRGYRTVRGSSTRGATRALIDLARVVAGGADAAVAVDGPRGPEDEAKPGIVLLAKITGCPIVPLGVGMNRYKAFGSWDRFRLPVPFSRVVLTAGEPVCVPPNAAPELMELKRRQLGRSLSVQRRRAADYATTHFARTDRTIGYEAIRNRGWS